MYTISPRKKAIKIFGMFQVTETDNGVQVTDYGKTFEKCQIEIDTIIKTFHPERDADLIKYYEEVKKEILQLPKVGVYKE